MVIAVVVFVAVAVLIMAIRSSRFGRRLLAVRDSEAACATFGLDLLGTRLAVFMLSAAIAGLGGAIYGTQLSAVTPNNFDFFTGLPIFMMVVVGGAGFVGGALFAGIGLYGFLPALTAIWAGLAKIQTVTPGLIGISLGKQPSGAAPQFSIGMAELRDDSPVLGGMLVGLAIAWGLRLAGVYEGWGMVAVMAVVAVGALALARRRADEAMGSALVAGTVAVAEVPLEWVGITVPWTAERLAEIDHHLCLQEFSLGTGAGAGSSVVFPTPAAGNGSPDREVARATP